MAGTFWNNSNNVASNVHIDDVGEYYDSTEVEGALQEIGEDFENLDVDISNKLDIDAPTIDNEVKTTKFNDTTDDASTRGEGTVKYNSTGKQLEFSDGVDWVPIGSQVTDGYDNPNPVMAQNIDGYTPYKDAAQSEPEDGTGGGPTVISVAEDITTPLIGDRSLVISKTTSNGQGEGVSYDVGIDEGNLGKTTQLRFVYKSSTNFDLGNVGVYLYDIDNSNLMHKLDDVPTGSGEFIATFYPSDSKNYRIIWHIQDTDGSAWSLTIDNVRIGEFNTAIGAAVGNWTDFTPNILGVSYSGINYAKYRRVGSTMEVALEVIVSSVTGPIGMDEVDGISLNVEGNIRVVGDALALDQGTAFREGVMRRSGGGVYAQQDSSAGAWNITNPFTWASGDALSMKYSVPIDQWTSNINLATDFTEYAYNTNTDYSILTDNTNFGNGIDGAELPDGFSGPLNGVCRRTVQFMRAIQPTDLLQLEVFDVDNDKWIPLGGGCSINGDFIEGLTYDGAFFGGLGITTEDASGSTQISINIGQERHNPGSYWDFAASTNTPRWRVRKVSGGNMAEVPRIVRAEYYGQTGVSAGSPIKWPTKIEDTHNAYDPSTGKFTAPLSGILTLHPGIPSANTNNHQIRLINNTSGAITGIAQTSPAATSRTIGRTVSVRVAKGDELRVVMNYDTSTSSSIYFNCVWELKPEGN